MLGRLDDERSQENLEKLRDCSVEAIAAMTKNSWCLDSNIILDQIESEIHKVRYTERAYLAKEAQESRDKREDVKVLVLGYAHKVVDTKLVTLKLYEDVVQLKKVEDEYIRRECLTFDSKREQIVVDLHNVKWYRYVSENSTLAKYAKDTLFCDKDWDAEGEPIITRDIRGVL